MLNKEIYRLFSIRSRIAYALVCLDLMYDKYNVNKNEKEYKYLTNSCWFFIGSRCVGFDFLDLCMDQCYKFIIKLPSKNLQTNNWKAYTSLEKETEAIELANKTLDGYKYDIPNLTNKKEALERYYLSLPISISIIYYYLYEIFEDGYDSGGDGSNDSFNTLHDLDLIIQTLLKANVELPPMEPFLFSKFSDNYGFGCPVSKWKIEEALERKL